VSADAASAHSERTMSPSLNPIEPEQKKQSRREKYVRMAARKDE
jgi:hypothetical protein